MLLPIWSFVILGFASTIHAAREVRIDIYPFRLNDYSCRSAERNYLSCKNIKDFKCCTMPDGSEDKRIGSAQFTGLGDKDIAGAFDVTTGCGEATFDRQLNADPCSYGNSGFTTCLSCGGRGHPIYGAKWTTPFGNERQQSMESLNQQCVTPYQGKRVERVVEQVVTPNSVTISGHEFDLDAMPSEEKSEMYRVFFNSTRVEDLPGTLLRFEINGK